MAAMTLPLDKADRPSLTSVNGGHGDRRGGEASASVESSNPRSDRAPTPPSVPACPARTYRVGFRAAAGGRRIAATKRRVHWRFGFGFFGAEELHDVTLVWSVASGKRLVLCDGMVIHFSAVPTRNKQSAFECTWTVGSGCSYHVCKVVALAAPPLTGKQFDLLVDGSSFFDMPEAFKLGPNWCGGDVISNIAARGASGSHYNDYWRLDQ